MASYNELNALIDAYINRNGVQAITGQILNGVLKAMVEQLGRGYTIMGAATPATDPGTPDGPECWFASEVGTYTDFDGLQIIPGELALLCYTPSGGWTKNTIYEGFQEVQATIDGNVGTPSVGVSYADGVLSFDFHNMKGNPGQNGQDGQDGDPAGFGTIGADITGGVGTPGVSVESSGPATAKNLQFHFTNLKGETGVTSVMVTVDNTTGTPTCTASLSGGVLTLAFTGLKGAQGNPGSSVDYPFTLVNNLTTDDPDQALTAAMGVQLESEITQLEAKLIKLTGFATDGQAGGITGVGQVYYNTSSKLLRRCITFPDVIHATYETVPYYSGAVYSYGDKLFYYDGTGLAEFRKSTFDYWDNFNAIFTGDFFLAEGIAVGDIGLHKRVKTNNTTVDSENYRYFWIKVKKGDVVMIRARGYLDNVAIAFNTSPDVATITNAITGNNNNRTPLVAPQDGFILVGFVYQESGTVKPAYVRYVPNPNDVIFCEDDFPAEDIVLAGVGSPVMVKSADKSIVPNEVYRCFWVKVKSGDTINEKVFGYYDNVAIGFNTKPDIASMSIEYAGVGDGTLQSYTATADGYVFVGYVYEENGVVNTSKVWCVKASGNTEGVEKDNRPIIKFLSPVAEAAGEMSGWTGNQIIENIYEPLRLAHPEYIKRKVIGRDASDTYDIYLYEFNNCVDEWFDLSQKNVFTSDIILPGNSGLTAKQCAIKKATFDSYFSGKTYGSIYFLVDFSVRKLEPWTTRTTQTINSVSYYVFTFETAPKVVDSGLEVWWTDKVETFDQHAMIVSGVHANEPAGYLGTALALKYLVEHHGENDALDYIFNHCKLSVVPIVGIWGSNQNPKVRTNADGASMNDWSGTLAPEQQAVADYVDSVKGELSFYADYHTSELWSNYGFVYAIPYPHIPLYPAVVATANFLCKKWFPALPPYNWNIGGPSGKTYGSYYMYDTYGVPGITVEFCGQDLMAFGSCERWSAQYMTYCLQNFLNFTVALCGLRIKNNSQNIISSPVFEKNVMS